MAIDRSDTCQLCHWSPLRLHTDEVELHTDEAELWAVAGTAGPKRQICCANLCCLRAPGSENAVAMTAIILTVIVTIIILVIIIITMPSLWVLRMQWQ